MKLQMEASENLRHVRVDASEVFHAWSSEFHAAFAIDASMACGGSGQQMFGVTGVFGDQDGVWRGWVA